MSVFFAYCSAYDRAAVKFRGAAATVNFPQNDYSKDWFMRVSAAFILAWKRYKQI